MTTAVKLWLMAACTLLLSLNNDAGVWAWKNTPQPSTIFKSQEVCQQILYEYGSFTCNTMPCLMGEYTKWQPWIVAKRDCLQRCQFSFGVSCAYGDIYTRGRSGLMQSLWCQCSGVSPKSVCEAKRAPIGTLYPDLDFSKLATATQQCKKYCVNNPTLTLEPNQAHCDLFELTSATGVPVITQMPSKRPTVLTNSPTKRPSTSRPTKRPTPPTGMPTMRPTPLRSTKRPSNMPTARPTRPTIASSSSPTASTSGSTNGEGKRTNSLRQLSEQEEMSMFTHLALPELELEDFDVDFEEDDDAEEEEEEDSGFLLFGRAKAKASYADHICTCGSSRE